MDKQLFTPLFSALPLDSSSVILQNTFTISQQPVLLTLTPSHILLNQHPSEPTPSHFAPLCFELKFEVIRPVPASPSDSPLTPPIAIVFENEQSPEKVTLEHANPDVIEEWALKL